MIHISNVKVHLKTSSGNVNISTMNTYLTDYENEYKHLKTFKIRYKGK